LGNNCTISTIEKDCGDELVCVDGKCTYCVETSQCKSRRHTLDCKITYDLDGKQVKTCLHKSLLPNVTWYDIGSAVATFFGGSFASATGTGGGAMFIPFFHIIGKFPTPMTIPLAKAMIAGEAICTVFIVIFHRHPHVDRPLVNYEIAAIFEPITLLGTIIGVYLNIIFPGWVISVLISLMLTLIFIRTFFKAMEEWKSETQQMEGNLPKEEYTHQLLTQEELSDEQKEELEEIVEVEKGTSWKAIFVIFIAWLIIVVTSVLKGGHGTTSPIGIRSCTTWYWVLVALPFPLIAVIIAITIIYVISRYKLKRKLGYRFARGDVPWTFTNTVIYPSCSFLVGIMSAFLGIGDGSMKAPLLLEMGLLPQIATATSGFMILTTSSSSAIQYWILGKLPTDYAVLFFINGFLSAAIGHFVVSTIVKKTGRPSILVWILAIVICCSAFLMTGLGGYEIYRDWIVGRYMGFKNPC
jgi:uncharacterized membrane protein YfcA